MVADVTANFFDLQRGYSVGVKGTDKFFYSLYIILRCRHRFSKRLSEHEDPVNFCKFQNISDFGSHSLLRAAQIRNDEKILTKVQGQNTIAIEVRYHRTCYKDYVRSEILTRLENENCELEDDSNAGYDNAFKTSECVHAEILIGAKALEMYTTPRKIH